VIEFQGHGKVVFRQCKFLGIKYARTERERGRFFTKPLCGLNFHWRKEHGNTFAHEIEHFIGLVGSPLKEEEVYKIRAEEKISVYSRIARKESIKSGIFDSRRNTFANYGIDRCRRKLPVLKWLIYIVF